MMRDESLALYSVLCEDQRVILQQVHGTHGATQKRYLAAYLALDQRIDRLTRQMGFTALANTRQAALHEWLDQQSFARKKRCKTR